MPPNEIAMSARNTNGKEREMRLISDALQDLRYGSITVIIQDGVIVQIDRTEKRRIRTGGES